MVQPGKQYDVREKEFGEYNGDPLHSWRPEKLRRKSLLHVHDFLTYPECKRDFDATTDRRLVLAEMWQLKHLFRDMMPGKLTIYKIRLTWMILGAVHPRLTTFPSTELQFRIGV